MTKRKIAFVADAHVERSAWIHRGIDGDAAYSLQQFVDYCTNPKNGVAAAFGLGDLLDRNVNRSYGPSIWQEAIKRLADAEIFWGIIQGNHDVSDPPWLLGPGSVHMHRQTVEIKLGDSTFNIYGIDWCGSIQLKEELAAVPDGVNVVLTHEAWEQYMGEIVVPEGTLTDVPIEGYLFSGDLHETHIDKHIGKDGQEFIFGSPGSTCMQAISEDADKFFLTLDESGSVEKVRLKTRPVIRSPFMNLDGELEEFLQGLDALLSVAATEADADCLPDQLVMPLMQIQYSHRLEDCVRRVTKMVAGRAHLFWKEDKPSEEERTDAVKLKPVKGQAATPLAMLPQIISATEEPEAYSLLESSLAVSDRKAREAVVAKFCSEYMAQEEV